MSTVVLVTVQRSPMFTCHCKKVCPTFHDLEAHVAGDHNDFAVYSCEFCKYSKFPTRYTVIQHYRNVHNIHEFNIHCTFPEDSEKRMAKIEQELYEILTAGQPEPTMAELKKLALTVLTRLNASSGDLASQPATTATTMPPIYGPPPTSQMFNGIGQSPLLMTNFYSNIATPMQGTPLRAEADSATAPGDISHASSSEMSAISGLVADASGARTSTPAAHGNANFAHANLFSPIVPQNAAPKPAATASEHRQPTIVSGGDRVAKKVVVKDEVVPHVVTLSDDSENDKRTPRLSNRQKNKKSKSTIATPTPSQPAAPKQRPPKSSPLPCQHKNFEDELCNKLVVNERIEILDHVSKSHWDPSLAPMVKCNRCGVHFSKISNADEAVKKHFNAAHPDQAISMTDNREKNEAVLIRMARKFFPQAEL